MKKYYVPLSSFDRNKLGTLPVELGREGGSGGEKRGK